MYRMAAIDDERPSAKPLRIGDVVEVTPFRAKTLRGERRERWYAVHTAVRRERWVQKELERLGYVTMTLLYNYRVGEGTRIRNLLPRYILVRFDLDDDPWAEIEEIEGVVGLIVNGMVPRAIPPYIIGPLAMGCIAGVYDRREARKYKRGEARKPGTKNRQHRRRDRRKAERAARAAKQWLAKARNLG